MTSINEKKIALVRMKGDSFTSEEQVNWALEILTENLVNNSLHVKTFEEGSDGEDVVITILYGGLESASNIASMKNLPDQPESFIIESMEEKQTITVIGSDSRGLVYALLELADIVKCSDNPLETLQNFKRIQEQPANPIRSVKRLFVNEQLDKLWFYDKSFWREYLTELASQRFNRFSLALGMGYDLGHDPDIKDFYFCFAYPFLVSVPGYSVKVKGLTDEERENNLQMLRFIGREAHRRGLEFQLGVWTHAYEPEDSPNLLYGIEGLNPENHAPYCREALLTLLKDCPEIDGLTIRVHYESGIPEPAHLFWKVVLEGPALCGRPINLDLHPKGIDDELLQVAKENGIPFTISPKFWAEHMALPYHQAAIRETELPIEPTPEAGKMIITTTSRRFTRYGYADFFKEDRNYDIFFRIWPGTQRVLLWGDPEMAAGYGRSGSFCGAKGIELMEPLSFKSRKTSQTPSGREPYADPSLQFGVNDWKKYQYSYRLWGRLLYNPDANPESWQRYLRSEFNEASRACEDSLKYASRILPLVTLAHTPSVANNHYWPEIYSNIVIVDTENKAEFHCDGREPHTFNVASPLDPALFYRIDEFAEDMVENSLSGKISPLETANLLEELALLADQNLQKAKISVNDHADPAFRRWTIDVEAQIGLGLFFANKFRAGTAFEFYKNVGDKSLLAQAIEFYRSAKTAWERIVNVTKNVYTDDITFGYVSYMRGHWADRLQAIEDDIKNMEELLQTPTKEVTIDKIERAKSLLSEKPKVDIQTYLHTPQDKFERGSTVKIKIELPNNTDSVIALKYRVANQSEKYQSVLMERSGEEFTAEIPSSYTDSPYPLIYFFEIESGKNKKMYPGFEKNLSNQPYFVIRQGK